ncbi:carbohydrate ABC transporter ATP-binding protein, CUT1 family [Verrucomicrobium sp. GAS474]|uniref:ABC transporter ATP-binding protein n=1 Tax=Verrucomicrobium sp. GAS474 TaxID=1882831 RepID=UPI00087CBA68|nr:sn-glycerol-3-phosphate ABC transporter ATP-binding protein UgpC [Verrucomicrobium sp. GAS474]SDT94143.1 carbohydrate ABC transporter ATP-binding protein, CUT1 family [Verrucomicrobium sp. GAS474]
MAKVVLEGVYKTYIGEKGREVVAVDDVNLTIEDREFIVLVGPSGCGKSTTLRMVAGLEEISRGGIYIDDRKINDVPPKDRDIAMVFQNYALYPHMTVRRNMAFGLELRGYPKAEINARVGEAASILGLSDEMLERKPKALSGGQRQRVAVGRAIVRKPRAFLFDEPLSNLDAKMRVQMRTEISKLHTRLASTMIYVTHDQVEAMTMGDRIVVMKDGRIQQVAEPLEIYNNPSNAFVAGFIGSPPMNFIEGTIEEGAGKLFFRETAPEGRAPVRLALPDGQARKLASHLGKPVLFGIRPEDLEDKGALAGADPDQVFQATIDVVEPMGAETFIYLNTGSHPLIARSQRTFREEIGKKIDLSANMKNAHFFENHDKERFRKANGEFDRDLWQAAARLIV